MLSSLKHLFSADSGNIRTPSRRTRVHANHPAIVFVTALPHIHTALNPNASYDSSINPHSSWKITRNRKSLMGQSQGAMPSSRAQCASAITGLKIIVGKIRIHAYFVGRCITIPWPEGKEYQETTRIRNPNSRTTQMSSRIRCTKVRRMAVRCTAQEGSVIVHQPHGRARKTLLFGIFVSARRPRRSRLKAKSLPFARYARPAIAIVVSIPPMDGRS
jgi:hypothetical protein